jgi:hypothetical protein
MQVNGQIHRAASLPPEKEPWRSSDKRLDETPSQSGSFERQKNSIPFVRYQNQFLGRLVVLKVWRLSYPELNKKTF